MVIPDPHVAPDDERQILLAELDHQRAIVVRKASGLTDEQAATSLVPSLTTVTGLLQHLALVERAWFRKTFAGDGWTWSYDFESDQDAEFRVTAETSLAAAIADYEAACNESRQAYANASLNDFAHEERERPPQRSTLRWIVVHLIAETARHNGHLDILREQLDGAMGE